MTEELPIVCLMGPTGAGKTALALRLLDQGPYEIVSVDSGMVYRTLDIGTAKPSPIVLQRAPHRLIDLCDPDARYSAAAFRADALRAIAEIRAARRIPLLVGGTGLYFRALFAGLAAMPAADAAVRQALAEEQARCGLAAMHARLATVDAEAARRIHPNDPQRILRALEVYALTGRALSDLQREHAPGGPPGAIRKIALAPAQRSRLHERIGQRFERMLQRGLINEVRAVLERRGDPAALPGLKLVGYREVLGYLRGACNAAELRARGAAATRQLARRQLTWLRAEPGVHWLDPDQGDLLEAAGKLLSGE